MIALSKTIDDVSERQVIVVRATASRELFADLDAFVESRSTEGSALSFDDACTVAFANATDGYGTSFIVKMSPSSKPLQICLDSVGVPRIGKGLDRGRPRAKDVDMEANCGPAAEDGRYQEGHG